MGQKTQKRKKKKDIFSWVLEGEMKQFVIYGFWGGGSTLLML
jgi:hypothetical protein